MQLTGPVCPLPGAPFERVQLRPVSPSRARQPLRVDVGQCHIDSVRVATAAARETVGGRKIARTICIVSARLPLLLKGASRLR